MSDEFAKARDCFFEGLGHYQAGRFAAAEAAFEASLVHVPGRASTLANLGATRLKLGRPEASLEALDQALAREPDDLDARSHRAAALADLGRHDEALTCHDAVLACDPQRAANWLLRGVVLNTLQRHAEALDSFAAFLRLRSDDAEGWLRHGQTLQFLERPEQALVSHDKALALDPTFALAWSHRGGILRDSKCLDEAAVAFRNAIAHGADRELNGYFLASVTGDAVPPHAPGGYVEPLFDDYAATFEQHLVGALNYQAHRLLVDNLAAVGIARFRQGLDLGCGTGLCGPLLRPWVERLDGVDLSQRMLERARALGAYERLVHAEIAAHLQATDQRYDLVLAADVFIYIGDLTPVFAGVQRVIGAGGIFCFSAELGPEAVDFKLLPSLRYAHAEPYLRGLADRHGFATVQLLRLPIREDQRQPVPGLFVYLRKR